ncbi:Predicted ATP-binding protein involved in virulence [Chitinophaga sp. YR573]|uniref:AAA family ATPase n=1 Tax=Chitinophaga sp. YR573 TaxID=1881040 RepID=UPI0008ABCD5B|nr:AAA family ATPase [Chitinophaga sp. YR573]SEW46001.1 Predicted ATP-binding protein involved in virulence [Chitinophaga sp. YR573]
MRVTSLYIDNYKMLKEFSINFHKDVSILIGINGSGKSTILESIAQIFSDAFLKKQSKFGFKLEYELRLEETLEQTATTSEFKTEYIKVEISASEKDEPLMFKVFSADKIIERENEIEKHFGNFEKILPSNIVIYYSGLAEIMKKICLPHDEMLSVNFRKGNTNIHRPFFYFEPTLFEIILLTLLSYEFGDIPEFLNQRAKIKGVESIKISLKKPGWGKGKMENWWGAKGEVKVFLDFLDSIGSPLLIDENSLTNGSKGNVVIEGWQNEVLNITIWGQEKLFEIREHFTEEKTFFKILNTLTIDGFAPEIKFSFIQEDGGKKTFNVLSEGEQQAIIIRGLIELVNNENTLFLFDEPDTYLHPSWQRNFIENINQLATINEINTSQFLITTHSPQLLSNADPASCDVQIMEDGEIVKVTPKYYGRDISTILYEMMGVERRNKKVAKSLSILFNLIEDEELEKSKAEYTKLVEILGEDDPAMIRAKTQLDYLQEDTNEAGN